MAHCMGLIAASQPARVALASSGNFAIALAWVGQRFGIPVTAVMMRRSHPWKVARVKDLGGDVLFCGDSTEERTLALERLTEEGVTILDHLVDPQVLVGHASLGLDVAGSLGPQPTLWVPASTGGLLVGLALAVKQLNPRARVIGVQPEGANALVRSFRCGHLQRVEPVVTECDALTANRPGQLPWELCPSWVDDMVEVSEAQVFDTVRWLVEEAKMVVEPGGAAALAALRAASQTGTEHWAVLSGGNLDPARLAAWCLRPRG